MPVRISKDEIKELLVTAKLKNSLGIKLKDIDFSGLDLSGINFGRSEFTRCVFNDNNLKKTKWLGAVLNDCRISNSDLSLAKLEGCTWQAVQAEQVTLKKTKAKRTNFLYSKLIAANFAGSDLSLSQFAGTLLSDVNLFGCKLSGANFISARFESIQSQKSKTKGLTLLEKDTSFFAEHNLQDMVVVGNDLYEEYYYRY